MSPEFIDKNYVENLIQTNERAIERALLALLERQTDDEINSEQTVHSNSRGFNGRDATFLTSLALRVKRGYKLSERQIAAVRAKSAKGYSVLSKYHRQLREVAIEKQARLGQQETAPQAIEQIQELASTHAHAALANTL